MSGSMLRRIATRWLLATSMVPACGTTEPTAQPPDPPPPAPSTAPSGPTAKAETPPPSSPKPPQPAAKDPLPTPSPTLPPASQSTSIGSPTFGRIEGGVALPAVPGLAFIPRKDPESRYGTVELVGALLRAAAVLHKSTPDVPITVGDLSRAEGGTIAGHASHRSGRDVDVLFVLRRDDDSLLSPSKFIPLDPDGKGTDYGDLSDPSDDIPVRLDVAATWTFVSALLSNEQAVIQKILIAEHLRTLLIEHAKRIDANPQTIERFAESTCQPRFPHDDHMHIRVFCSAEDIGLGCEDTAPIFRWHARALKAQGLTVTMAGKGPDSRAIAKQQAGARPKLKTLEQARAEAGPMHADVVEFLERREAWATKPHPGRRYCR